MRQVDLGELAFSETRVVIRAIGVSRIGQAGPRENGRRGRRRIDEGEDPTPLVTRAQRHGNAEGGTRSAPTRRGHRRRNLLGLDVARRRGVVVPVGHRAAAIRRCRDPSDLETVPTHDVIVAAVNTVRDGRRDVVVDPRRDRTGLIDQRHRDIAYPRAADVLNPRGDRRHHAVLIRQADR